MTNFLKECARYPVYGAFVITIALGILLLGYLVTKIQAVYYLP